MKLKNATCVAFMLFCIAFVVGYFSQPSSSEVRLPPTTWELQQLLRDQGYDLKIDGIIGNETLTCWKDWQKKYWGVQADQMSKEEIEGSYEVER